MSDVNELEPGEIVATVEGPPGRYIGEGLCLIVVNGGLRVGQVAPDAPKPDGLCPVHDLEVLAAGVVLAHAKERRA